MVIHKKIIYSVVSLACGLVMYQQMKNTCPPKEQHQKAVTDVVERAVDRIFMEKVKFPDESKQLATYLSESVIPQAVAKLTEKQIDVSSFGVFSLGTIDGLDEGSVPVSFGLCGKVFTIDEDEVYKYINNMLDEDEINNILKTINEQNNGTDNSDIETEKGE